jgi:hypothetical protein
MPILARMKLGGQELVLHLRDRPPPAQPPICLTTTHALANTEIFILGTFSLCCLSVEPFSTNPPCGGNLWVHTFIPKQLIGGHCSQITGSWSAPVLTTLGAVLTYFPSSPSSVVAMCCAGRFSSSHGHKLSD